LLSKSVTVEVTAKSRIKSEKNVVTAGVEPAIRTLLRKVSSTALRASQQREAADAIKAVTASYDYKPGRSCLRGQAGAAIASKNSGKAGLIPTAPSKIPLVNLNLRNNI